MRTDKHRPATLIPSDYRFVTHLISREGIEVGYGEYRSSAKAGTLADVHPGAHACDFCGARYVEGALFVHTPSGEHVTVGWQCADKLDFSINAEAERGFAKKLWERAARKAERHEALRAFVAETAPEIRRALRVDHDITRDIRARLIDRPEWGLSEAQINLLLKLAREAAEQASKPEDVYTPVIPGSYEVRGEVVALGWKENAYGERLVFTVKVPAEADDGVFLLWGTVPAAIADGDVEVGDAVQFTANVERGDREEHFGFFKRPRRASIVSKTRVTRIALEA